MKTAERQQKQTLLEFGPFQTFSPLIASGNPVRLKLEVIALNPQEIITSQQKQTRQELEVNGRSVGSSTLHNTATCRQ